MMMKMMESFILFLGFVQFMGLVSGEVYPEPDGKPVVGTINPNIAKVYQGRLYLTCNVNSTGLMKIVEEMEKNKEGNKKKENLIEGLSWWNTTSGNKVEIVLGDEDEDPRDETENGEEEEEEEEGSLAGLKNLLESTVEDKPEKTKVLKPVRMDKNRLMLFSEHEYDLIGTYECEYEGKTQEFRSIRPLLVSKFKPSYTVTEGDDQKIHCEVKDPKPDNFHIKWLIRNLDGTLSSINNTLESDGVEPHIKTYTKNNVENAELKIEDVMKNDRTIYVCEITSDEEIVTLETLVRVKDKYAAVWPFIGIVVEVVLLCVIILVCEKRKEGDDIEDDVTLAGVSGSNDAVENSNLRHRK